MMFIDVKQILEYLENTNMSEMRLDHFMLSIKY